MNLLEDLVASLPQATIHEINLGKYWTLVQVENEGRLYGGLAKPHTR